MENNIEKLIRDDFHKREIQPSANAFDRLEAKLDIQAKNKRKKLIRILSIAASFVGIVIILQFALKTTNTEIITGAKDKDSARFEAPNSQNFSTVASELLDTVSDEVNIADSKKPINTISVKRKIIPVIKNKSQPKMSDPKTVKKELLITKSIDISEQALKDAHSKLFVKKEVTDEELDVLLASARQSIQKQIKDSITVNSQRMLYEIEVKINKPLPEKVLLTLKTGATNIKEIVKPNTNKYQ